MTLVLDRRRSATMFWARPSAVDALGTGQLGWPRREGSTFRESGARSAAAGPGVAPAAGVIGREVGAVVGRYLRSPRAAAGRGTLEAGAPPSASFGDNRSRSRRLPLTMGCGTARAVSPAHAIVTPHSNSSPRATPPIPTESRAPSRTPKTLFNQRYRSSRSGIETSSQIRGHCLAVAVSRFHPTQPTPMPHRRW